MAFSKRHALTAFRVKGLFLPKFGDFRVAFGERPQDRAVARHLKPSLINRTIDYGAVRLW